MIAAYDRPIRATKWRNISYFSYFNLALVITGLWIVIPSFYSAKPCKYSNSHCVSCIPTIKCAIIIIAFLLTNDLSEHSRWFFDWVEQILKAHVVFFCLTDQLERVFLRLGHAETDDQLQDIISKFLPPVLLKLSSVQEGVRKKVMHTMTNVRQYALYQHTDFLFHTLIYPTRFFLSLTVFTYWSITV